MTRWGSVALGCGLLTACGGKALDGSPGGVGAQLGGSGGELPSEGGRSGAPFGTGGASAAGGGSAGKGGSAVVGGGSTGGAGAPAAGAAGAGPLCAADADCDSDRFCARTACALRAVQLAAGEYHTCVALIDGSVRCWGRGANGQLGNGARLASTPVTVSGSSDVRVTSLALGGRTSCAALDDGTARCWGDGSEGQLGTGPGASSAVPISVPGLASVRSLALGQAHACALSASGAVRCWGSDALWNPPSTIGPDPALDMLPLAPAGRVLAAYDRSCMQRGQELWCWARTGRSSTSEPLPPESGPMAISEARIPGLAIVDFSQGRAHACAAYDDGSVRCWGDNQSLQLGGTRMTYSSPAVLVDGLPAGNAKAVAVSTGGYHSCALLSDHDVRCWGAELSFGAGIGTLHSYPRSVPGLTDSPEKAVRIVSGNAHNCALMSNGSVRCWGFAAQHELGTGDEGVHGTALRVDPW